MSSGHYNVLENTQSIKANICFELQSYTFESIDDQVVALNFEWKYFDMQGVIVYSGVTFIGGLVSFY